MSVVENSIITIRTSEYSHCWKKPFKLVFKKCKMVSKTQYLPVYNYKVASIGFYSPLSLVQRSKVFFNNDWQIHKARSWVLLTITKGDLNKEIDETTHKIIYFFNSKATLHKNAVAKKNQLKKCKFLAKNCQQMAL